MMAFLLCTHLGLGVHGMQKDCARASCALGGI